MELDTTLLNTQHYKVRFKGKVEQSREWSSALPYTLVQQLSKREPSGHPRLQSLTLLTYTIQQYHTLNYLLSYIYCMNLMVSTTKFEHCSYWKQVLHCHIFYFYFLRSFRARKLNLTFPNSSSTALFHLFNSNSRTLPFFNI